MKQMEILSPAGNPRALVAAVRTGANAVYLGLKEFSARRNADNFDYSELKAACEYCRERDVKVYVAINTMIKETEMPAALECARRAYICGADALIVSDIGFISALRKHLPQIELHASTQMTVHSPASLKALKSLGISRVVLAREMSRDEIKAFCIEAKRCEIDVEVFVHGALCMCVSGKCLLSAALGGRSGNRGLCAGPCRLEFSSSGTGRYDLSLKDLSLVPYLKELEAMGVASAKIEGRMKREEYVAAATAACRASLDGTVDAELNTALKSVFSRSGFTDGYYKNTLGADMFGIRTKDDADAQRKAFSFLHSLYRTERQSVPIKISAVVNENITEITVKDRVGTCVTVTGEKPQTAQTREIDEQSVLSLLTRLGGTPYFAESAKARVQSGLFVSAGTLNELRRRAIEELSKRRRFFDRRADLEYHNKPSEPDKIQGQKVFTKFLSSALIPANITADGVILPINSDFGKLPENLIKVAELPRYITDEEKLKNRLSALKNQGVYTAFCDNLEALAIAKKSGFKAILSIGFNCANRESIEALKKMGADMITLSAETNMSGAKALAESANIGIFAYGRLPLMLTRNCPIKNTKTCKECKGKSALTDRLGVKFPVVCRDGYCEVLNSAPIYLADKKDDLSAFGFIILSFADETPDTAQKIINYYILGASPTAEFTRGMYYKNIP